MFQWFALSQSWSWNGLPTVASVPDTTLPMEIQYRYTYMHEKGLRPQQKIYIYIASTDRSEQPRGERWDSPPSPRPPGPCGAPGSGQRPHGHPANQICTVNLDPDPEFSWKSDTVNLDPDRVHVVTLPYNRRHLATFVPVTIGQYNYTGIRMTFLLEWRRGLGKWERGKPKSA